MRHPIVHGHFTPKSARRLNLFFGSPPDQAKAGTRNEELFRYPYSFVTSLAPAIYYKIICQEDRPAPALHHDASAGSKGLNFQNTFLHLPHHALGLKS